MHNYRPSSRPGFDIYPAKSASAPEPAPAGDTQRVTFVVKTNMKIGFVDTQARIGIDVDVDPFFVIAVAVTILSFLFWVLLTP